MCQKLVYLTSFVLVVGLAVGAANADIKTGLVGYWPLNEGAGDTTAEAQRQLVENVPEIRAFFEAAANE